MKSIKKVLCLTFAALLCFGVLLVNGGGVIPAFADSPAPQVSYKIEIENGAKFFYMRGSENDEEFLDLEPGLYYSDTLENIYTIEPIINQGKSYRRYIYQGCLVLSEDGKYFANLPWTVTDGEWYLENGEWKVRLKGQGGPAIEFFKNGTLKKQYYLTDLVCDLSKVSFSESHVQWEERAEREFNADKNRLSVTTLDGTTYVFDITDGTIYIDPNSIIEKLEELNEKYETLNEKFEELNERYGALSDRQETLTGKLYDSNKTANRNAMIMYILIAVVFAALILGVIVFGFGAGKRKKSQ